MGYGTFVAVPGAGSVIAPRKLAWGERNISILEHSANSARARRKDEQRRKREHERAMLMRKTNSRTTVAA